MENRKTVRLQKKFDTKGFNAGASMLKQLLWYFTSALFFRSGLVPVSVILVWILRLFGAKIGKDVRVKPYIHIKFPWKLELGDHSWLAECYIENLAPVLIGKHCCVSQNAVLMTGNHDYKSTTFDLITKPIVIEDGAWVGANAVVCPGVTVGSHAVLAVGSVATKDLETYVVYAGHPAVKIRERVIRV
ncbi:acyl transferase [Pelobium manganitolerans]|uniref:Acyl transferase n=1 Tax=Pelobium manganitolerans TaxID=1842495 RepID=A0A419S1Q9_9SPHI|nr:WcaF family extracellular polysaccharide biosynthesis acetyltransferase [Pelobium manganitolerans]RKD12426.1 acyl transferase [Pelobium manganitolerans]